MTISRDSSLGIKGLCIILIVLHHYSQSYGYVPEILKGMGPVACSAFFFISGYGLAINCGDRKKWGERLKRLYCPFVLCNVLYLMIQYCFLGSVSNWKVYLAEFLGIKLINGHCWFIQILLVFYFLTACVDIYFKNNRKTLVPLLTLVGGASYSLLTHSVGSISWIAFPIGFFLSDYKLFDEIGVRLLFMFFSLISFSAYFYYGNLVINTGILIINFVVLVVTMPFTFILFGNVLSKSKVLMMLGMHSIDIYLTHGAIIILLSRLFWGEPIRVLLYVTGVVLLAFIFGFIRKRIIKNS